MRAGVTKEAFAAGPRRAGASDAFGQLVACLSVIAAVDPFLFTIAPSVANDLRGTPAPVAPELKTGDRVWCYPGRADGFEAVVEGPNLGFPGDTIVKRANPDLLLSIQRENVVKFDVNHNQKRAYARGKTIQYRIAFMNAWEDCDRAADAPIWHPNAEYRVKPEPAPYVKRVLPRSAHVPFAVWQAAQRGERIEARLLPTLYNPHPAHRWHYVETPAWVEGVEYRVQPPKAERDYSVGSTLTAIDPDFAAIENRVLRQMLDNVALATNPPKVITSRGDNYDFKPRVKDEFADLKAAVLAGKAIETSVYGDGWTEQAWRADLREGTRLNFAFERSKYRVKPEPVVSTSMHAVAIDYGRVKVSLDVTSIDGKVTNVTVKDFS